MLTLELVEPDDGAPPGRHSACGTAQRRYVSVHKGTPPVDYRPVETDGAARAAGLLAELL
jgi:hypothetical protein